MIQLNISLKRFTSYSFVVVVAVDGLLLFPVFPTWAQCLAIRPYIENMEYGHRQSDEHWNRFKGGIGET